MKNLFCLVFLAASANYITYEYRPPIITKHPSKEVWFEAGQYASKTSYSFVCEAVGTPSPIFFWQKNGKLFIWKSTNRFSLSKMNGTLTISHPSDTDTGTYRCFAKNRHGLAASNTVHFRKIHVDFFKLKSIFLNVTQPKKINQEELFLNGEDASSNHSKHLYKRDVRSEDKLSLTTSTFNNKNQTVYLIRVNSNATLSCNIKRDSLIDVNVHWTRNKVLINLKNRSKFKLLSDKSLKIFNASYADSGNYICFISTPSGITQVSSILDIKNIPDTPVLNTFLCRRKNATISWMPSANNGLPILNYIIQYATEFFPYWSDITVSPIVSKFTFNMIPWTNHTFRIIAANKIGKSLPSENSSICESEPDRPYRNPVNVKAFSNLPKGLNISWTPMPPSEHNGPNFYYKISWGTQGVKRFLNNEVEVHNWTQSFYFVEHIIDLQKYKIKVIAANELGIAYDIAQAVECKITLTGPIPIEVWLIASIPLIGYGVLATVIGVYAYRKIYVIDKMKETNFDSNVDSNFDSDDTDDETNL